MALKTEQAPYGMIPDVMNEIDSVFQRVVNSRSTNSDDMLEQMRNSLSPAALDVIRANEQLNATITDAIDSAAAARASWERTGTGETTVATSQQQTGWAKPVSIADFVTATAFPTAYSLATQGEDKPAILGAMALDLGLMAAGGVVGRGVSKGLGRFAGRLAEAGTEVGGTALQTEVAGAEQSPVALGLSAAIPLRRELAMAGSQLPGVALKAGGKTAQAVGAERVGANVIAAGEALQELPQSLVQSLRANVKRIDDFDAMEMTARELGLDPKKMPAALEFGLDSPPAVLERRLMQGNESGAYQNFKEWQEAAQNGVREAVDELGPVLDPSAAGELIREGVLNRVRNLSNEAGVTFKGIAKQLEERGERIYAPASVEAQLDELVTAMDEQAASWEKSSIKAQKQEAEVLREYAQAIMSARTENGYDFAQLNEVRKWLGDEAFGNPKLATERMKESVSSLRKAYSLTSDALVEAVDGVDAELAQELRDANKFLTEMLGENSVIAKSIGSERGEKAGSAIFRSATADERKLLALKNLLNDEEWNAVRASLVNEKLYSNASRELKFASSNRNLQNELRKSARILLTPAERAKLERRLELGFRLGETVRPGEYASIGFGERARIAAENLLREQRLRAAQAYAKGAASGIAERAPARIASKSAETVRSVGRNIPAAGAMGLVPLPFGESDIRAYEEEKSRGPR